MGLRRRKHSKHLVLLSTLHSDYSVGPRASAQIMAVKPIAGMNRVTSESTLNEVSALKELSRFARRWVA